MKILMAISGDILYRIWPTIPIAPANSQSSEIHGSDSSSGKKLVSRAKTRQGPQFSLAALLLRPVLFPAAEADAVDSAQGRHGGGWWG